MIPTTREVLDGLPWLERRFALPPPPARISISIDVALAEARVTIRSPADAPADLFFAFARRARGLGAYWDVLSRGLALQAARRLGCTVRCDVRALATLRTQVALEAIALDDVRRWFAERTEKI